MSNSEEVIDQPQVVEDIPQFPTSREDFTYLAKLVEETERFEDMAKYIKKVFELELGVELSFEQRDLLSISNKNRIESYKAALMQLKNFEKKEEEKSKALACSEKYLTLIRNYKKKIEEELNLYINDILNLVDSHLIQVKKPEGKIIFLKIKGDFQRYICEYAIEDQRQKALEEALFAYNAALTVADCELHPMNLIRLELILNFSIFCYEILNDPVKAIELSKSALVYTADFDETIMDYYKEIITLMILIRNNIILWEEELDNAGMQILNH